MINIKVRSTGKLLKSKIDISDDFANVKILEKETGISPGQACVFYAKDEHGDKVSRRRLDRQNIQQELIHLVNS